MKHAGARLGFASPALAMTSDQIRTTAKRMPLLSDAARLLRRATLSVKGRATVAPDSLPLYESEALGGESSVRGYEAGELGRALSSICATAELNVPLSASDDGAAAQPIAMAIFADWGAGMVVSSNPAEGAGRVSLNGGGAVGCGLRYGPFRIDYALNRDRQFKVHVGVIGAD